MLHLELSYFLARGLSLIIPFSHFPPPFVLSIWESISISVYLFICFIFWIQHISENIWYLAFSVWLTSLSKTLSSFICSITSGKISFFYGCVIFHCVYTPQLLHPFICRWPLRLLLYLSYWGLTYVILKFVVKTFRKSGCWHYSVTQELIYSIEKELWCSKNPNIHLAEYAPLYILTNVL